MGLRVEVFAVWWWFVGSAWCVTPAEKVIDATHARAAALRLQLLRSPGYDDEIATSVAALYLNENRTAMEDAAAYLWNVSDHFGSAYLITTYVRAFALFNSRTSYRDAKGSPAPKLEEPPWR